MTTNREKTVPAIAHELAANLAPGGHYIVVGLNPDRTLFQQGFPTIAQMDDAIRLGNITEVTIVHRGM
jgi:hypothetical protein